MLQLRWFHQFQFAGYYAALEQGYYRDAGLDVTIRERDAGQDPVAEVLEGRAQFGVTNSEILLQALSGKPLVVMAAIFQHSPLVFVARKESGINSPHDFIGRNVKLSRQTRDVELHAMLRNEGVTLDQLQFTNGEAGQKDYLNPNIDALAAYITNQPFFLAELGIDFTVIKPITYGIDFYGDCLFTSTEQIAANPEQSRAFLKASLEGWLYALENTEELVDLIINKYGAKKTRAHLFYEALRIRELILPKLVQMGHMNPGRWRHITETFARLGMVDPQAATPQFYQDFIYDPAPKPDLSGVYRILWVLGALIVVIAVAMALLFVFTRKLQGEVTQRTKAEEALQASQDFLHLVLNNIPQFIFWKDERGRYKGCNMNFARAAGFAHPEELIGKSEAEMPWRPEEISALQESDQRVLESQDPEHLVVREMKQANDETILIETNKIPLIDAQGETVGLLGAFEDITIRKQNEEQLARLNQHLESLVELRTNELQEKARELEAANEKLLKLDEAKSQFLSSVSHELRTPLTSVLGFAKIITKSFSRRFQPLAEENEELTKHGDRIIHNLDVITHEGERLTRMVNNVLDLNKIEAGKMDWKNMEVDLIALLRHAVELSSGLFSEKTEVALKSRLDTPLPMIMGDSDRLLQVFLNLIQNAAKFTAHGEVLIQADTLENGDVRIRVSDTGQGIPAQDLDKVFDYFHQIGGGDTVDENHKGTGLGLAISAQIIEHHGGAVRVESQEGRGATFFVELPAGASAVQSLP